MVTIIIVLDLQNTAYYKKMQYNNEETIHRVVGILNFGARLWVLISAPPLTGVDSGQIAFKGVQEAMRAITV